MPIEDKETCVTKRNVVHKHPLTQSRKLNQIPDDILNNKKLNEAIDQLLPKNYNFEIQKSLWQIRKNESKRVALQFPEGLLMFSCVISDILEEFGMVETLIMGDVTYGACCVDDFTARAIGCDFMVHYGHSCLVPVGITTIKTLYVFVDIGIDKRHFVDTVVHNLSSTVCNTDETNSARKARHIEIEQETDYPVQKTIALVSTIQFVASLQSCKQDLEDTFQVVIPQARPLSPGEILGCTAPKLNGADFIVYLGDGRFHLESIMIANPTVPAYRYDPYTKKFTREYYDHYQMLSVRSNAIQEAKNAKNWGIILGTLGRQGNTRVLDYLKDQVTAQGKSYTLILLSEIFPTKLAQFKDIDCFVQIACPRLSIDWGYAFEKPLLTPYECAIVLGLNQGFAVDAVQMENMLMSEEHGYPMDFYAKDSLGPWTPNHAPSKPSSKKKTPELK